MKNTILVTSIVFFAAVLFLWGRTGSSRPADSVALVTNSAPAKATEAKVTDLIPVYDFGPVSMLKGNVEHEFVINNTTDTDLAITQAETSCMCTRAILKLPDGKEKGPFGMPGHGFTPSINAVVRPDEKLSVRVIFDPAAHGPAGIGRIEREVTLTTNKGPIVMQFRAQVTP
ncbi:MAG: DUF1573 domain-containing protein [bacterium]|nr:DUF1573 domain-containing protein [bacterium]